MNLNARLFNAKLVVVFLILFAAASPLWGQIDRGAIVGAVRDSSGAVIPNATVTVANKDTGVSVSTQTNSDGAYQVLALIPGTYSAAASASGFGKQTQSGIVIHVQSRLNVNFSLNVGAVRQEVVVTTLPELLQTQTAAVGHVIGSRQIVDLPLNGRVMPIWLCSSRAYKSTIMRPTLPPTVSAPTATSSCRMIFF
ncbi:MAG: carboxypeptidase-like regulatory domain-containing protein [Terriglobia bacterium]